MVKHYRNTVKIVSSERQGPHIVKIWKKMNGIFGDFFEGLSFDLAD